MIYRSGFFCLASIIIDICIFFSVLFFFKRSRSTVSWKFWYERLTRLNDHSTSDDPFCVAKQSDFHRKGVDNEAFEDMIRQGFACPGMFILCYTCKLGRVRWEENRNAPYSWESCNTVWKVTITTISLTYWIILFTTGGCVMALALPFVWGIGRSSRRGHGTTSNIFQCRTCSVRTSCMMQQAIVYTTRITRHLFSVFVCKV